jgi:hypothetical protein
MFVSRLAAAALLAVAPLCVFFLPPAAHAVFLDEAYRTDFHYALFGSPGEHATFFHRPQPASPAALLYTLSEKLVVGAVNPQNGSIVWRQQLLLQPGSAASSSSSSSTSAGGFLRAVDGQDTVISALGGQVTAWDAWTGKEVWSNEFGGGDDNGAVVRALEVIALDDRLSRRRKGVKDTLALFSGTAEGEGGNGIVRRLSGRTGNVLWEFIDDRSGDPDFLFLLFILYIYLFCFSNMQGHH